MSDTKFKLGDRVRILGTVEKVRTFEDNGTLSTRYEEVNGAPWDYSGQRKEGDWKRTYEEGVIVGKRSPQAGKTYYSLDEYYSYNHVDRIFKSTGSVTIYLVAYSLYRKHVMCFPSQLEIISDVR